MDGNYYCRAVRVALCGLALTGAAGCPVVSNREAPGRQLIEKDPDYGRPYSLYVPTQYHETGETRRWPLVVTCHGTPPWDTARHQFDEWKGLAEQKGFLLVAPDLIGTRGDFLPSTEEQIERQMADEKAILAIVRAVQAAHSIDDTRVFLTGWSAGGYAVMFTGLRNPNVFRALSVRQGNFEPAFIEPCIPFLDRFQSVQILYGDSDLLKDQALAAVDWLRNHGMEPTVLSRQGFHRRDPEPVFAFFAQVVRSRPWVRVAVADDPLDSMRVRFSTRTSKADSTMFGWRSGRKRAGRTCASFDCRCRVSGWGRGQQPPPPSNPQARLW
jgi:poly(3-hydroxybutyrate) depolymerase